MYEHEHTSCSAQVLNLPSLQSHSAASSSAESSAEGVKRGEGGLLSDLKGCQEHPGYILFLSIFQCDHNTKKCRIYLRPVTGD